MKAYVVKAKAKLGKLPSKEICRDLLYEDSLERKLDIIRANKSEIPNIYSKKDVEIFLSNSLYDDLNSFLKFLNKIYFKIRTTINSINCSGDFK